MWTVDCANSVNIPTMKSQNGKSGRGIKPSGRGIEPRGRDIKPSGRGIKSSGRDYKPNGRGIQPTWKGIKPETSAWIRMITSESKWPDKDEFLDVIYWIRQVLGIFLGLIWGFVPFTGVFGLALFLALNLRSIYIYFSVFQGINEDEYGGTLELTKEGFVTSFALFLVSWTIMYTGLHFSDQDIQPYVST